MPSENGIQFNFDNVYLWGSNGETLFKVTEIQEFDDTYYAEDHGDEIWGKIDFNREISFTGHFDGDAMLISRMWKILYGWKAKGPVRKRVLGKLWGLRR